MTYFSCSKRGVSSRHRRLQWNDCGSESRIRDAAKKFKAHVHPPFTLTAQFRCGGSDGYLNWLDDVLHIRPTGNFDNWADAQYEFRVFDDAADLYRTLTARNAENKARLVAGYSWDWPTEGRRRRGHVKHVTVDGLSLPWNFSGENWATAADGIGQVGCVHTCQGVEFDWLGVLIGPDLRFEDGRIVCDPAERARTDNSLKGWKKSLREAKGDHDATEAVLAKVQAIIKNTYKVLLSRGRKGCFVWCADPGLRQYLRDRLRLASRTFTADAGETESSPLLHRFESSHNARVVGARTGCRCTTFESRPDAISDPENGGSYTVKKYRSLKVRDADAGREDAWTHAAIQLVALNAEFPSIWINPD